MHFSLLQHQSQLLKNLSSSSFFGLINWTPGDLFLFFAATMASEVKSEVWGQIGFCLLNITVALADLSRCCLCFHDAIFLLS